jgi:hypothetical protein
MPWTEEDMKALGLAHQNIRRVGSLISELESLSEPLYEDIIGDDGETIERCHRLIHNMQTYIEELELQKWGDYNKRDN